jgi:hypothetical protein
VNPNVYKQVSPPAYDVGDKVSSKGRLGVIADVEWHFKHSSPIYFLEFAGKRSSKRYAEDEIAAATA